MRIGIIAAMSAEKELIEREMTNVFKEPYRSFVFVCGTISNNEIILVQSGVGKVNSSVAVTLLASKYECSLIINTGIAGGIMPLQTKDVVIATKLSYSDVDATAFGYKYGQVPSMPQFYTPQDGGVLLVKKALNKLGINYKEATVYSADSFVTSFKQIESVKPIEGSAIEMEGCAIAQAAFRLGVDFIIIRYISDVIGAKSQFEDYNKFEEEMAIRSSGITLELLKQIEVQND